MEYVTQNEFKNAINDIKNIKLKIASLEEKKADAKVLQGIKSDIKLLNNSIDSMKDDRAEDKEMIKDLREEVKSLSDLINNSNISTIEMKVNQKNIDEKIVDLKADINLLSAGMKDIQKSVDNSLWHIYCKLYKEYLFIRICTKILTVVFILIIFSSCLFYVTNGIPWDKLNNIRSWVG